MSSVAILGIGAALHVGNGHERPCQLFKSEAAVVSAKADLAADGKSNTGQEPKCKKKGHEHKRHLKSL